jgi:hypothetical protein
MRPATLSISNTLNNHQLRRLLSLSQNKEGRLAADMACKLCAAEHEHIHDYTRCANEMQLRYSQKTKLI